MNQLIENSIFISRILIVVMLIPYIAMQWRVRKQNGIVRRLRRHTIAETIALIFLFITIAVSRKYAGIATNSLVWELLLLFSTLGVLVTFASGTKLFFDIQSGKYNNQIK